MLSEGRREEERVREEVDEERIDGALDSELMVVIRVYVKYKIY